MPLEHFDDFLGLASHDFSRCRMLVFEGESGSGKSTAIDWLVSTHCDFDGRSVRRIEGPPFESSPDTHDDVLIVDEIFDLRDLPVAVRAMRSARTVLFASHVAPFWFHLIAPFAKKAFFRTDRDAAKIARHLERLRIPASRDAIDLYVSRYGATYTDLEIILERSPRTTFDESLAHFMRFASIELA